MSKAGSPTKYGATQMAQVVEVAPSQQSAQGVSAHQHRQQSAQLDRHPWQKDELRRGTCSVADNVSLVSEITEESPFPLPLSWVMPDFRSLSSLGCYVPYLQHAVPLRRAFSSAIFRCSRSFMG